MDISQKNKAKCGLFTMWVNAGPTKVFFDSGFPEVRVLARFRGDPEMWMVVRQARVTSAGMTVDVELSDKELFEAYVPWGAVHTLESEVFGEVHVWGDDLRAAQERKSGIFPKEIKN